MDRNVFRQWRTAAMNLSRQDAATALGVSAQTIINWERGKRPDGNDAHIPQWVSLACRALYHRLRPWDGQP